MIRVNVLLLVAVVLSALYLVHTQYESRRLCVELEKAALQMRKLEMESESALAEKRAQATPMRVDKLAKEKLQMQPATPAITHYVAYRDTTAAPAQVKP